MADTTVTTLNDVLKELYIGQKVPNLEYAKHPFLANVKKFTGFQGKNLPIPLQYGSPQGASASFSTAQANKTASLYEQFTLTRTKDYSLVTIQNEAIKASQGDSGSFIRGLKNDIDGAFRTCTRSIARNLFRNGDGALGTINGTVTGTTVTLETRQDIVNFEVGMEIQFANPSTALRDSGQAIGITDINRSAGSFTVDENLNVISGLAESDQIIRQGDFQSVLSGLEAWIPASAPDSTAFYSVDRTADITRLSGCRLDASSMSIEEGLIEGAMELAAEGGQPDVVYMNYNKVGDLIKELGNRARYENHQVGEFGFKALKLMTPAGELSVIGDQNCQLTAAWMLQSDTWCLYSLGEAPMLLDSDGNQYLRESDDDSVEVRVGAYLNLGCTAPGWNIRITLPS